jgi:hypothetical protein
MENPSLFLLNDVIEMESDRERIDPGKERVLRLKPVVHQNHHTNRDHRIQQPVINASPDIIFFQRHDSVLCELHPTWLVTAEQHVHLGFQSSSFASTSR